MTSGPFTGLPPPTAASGALILDAVLQRILDVKDETPELALWVTTGSEGSVPAMAWGAEELMAVYQQVG